jgi:hypothetical protein
MDFGACRYPCCFMNKVCCGCCFRSDLRCSLAEVSMAKEFKYERAKITEDMFIEAVGRRPRQDDMSRANCVDAGKMGHHFCGWCEIHNKPRWHCIH